MIKYISKGLLDKIQQHVCLASNPFLSDEPHMYFIAYNNIFTMNSKIKPREKICNENLAHHRSTFAEPTNRTMKSSIITTRNDKPAVISNAHQASHCSTKPFSGRPTTSYKNFLSPTRDTERICFEAQPYDVVFVDIREIDKGTKIQLLEDKENTCVITLTLDTTDVDRNKVKHSFPMPRLLTSTKFIKLPVRDFSEKPFSIVATSLKGRIRDGSVSISYPILSGNPEEQAIVQVNPLNQIQQAERIRRRKFQGKDWTLKASRSATFIRDLCSPRQANQKQDEKSMMTSLRQIPHDQQQLKTPTANHSFFPKTHDHKPPATNHYLPVSPTYQLRPKPGTTAKETSCFLSPKASQIDQKLSRVVSGSRLFKANKTTVNLNAKQEPSISTNSGTFKKKQFIEPLKIGLISRGPPTTPQIKTVRSPRAYQEHLSSKVKFVSNAINKTMRVAGNGHDLAISRMLDYQPKYINLQAQTTRRE